MSPRAKNPTLNVFQLAKRSSLSRAGLLGLCCGLVIIGFMENTRRFAEPETLSTNARLQESTVTLGYDSRANRLDTQLVSTAPSVGLAQR